MKSLLIKNSLLELGLDALESDLYISLLSDPKPNITKLAKTFGVQRLTIYRALEKLGKLELVKHEENYSRKFEVESPAKITGLLKAKNAHTKKLADDLTANLPDLLFEFHKTRRSPKVRYYETEADFINLLTELVDEADGEIYCIGSPDILRFLPQNMQEYIKYRVKRGVKSKHLSFRDRSFALRQHKNELREVKWLPEGLNTEAAVIAYGNKVAIWNTAFPKIVVIEDKYIFNLFKIMFDVLWKDAPAHHAAK